MAGQSGHGRQHASSSYGKWLISRLLNSSFQALSRDLLSSSGSLSHRLHTGLHLTLQKLLSSFYTSESSSPRPSSMLGRFIWSSSPHRQSLRSSSQFYSVFLSRLLGTRKSQVKDAWIRISGGTHLRRSILWRTFSSLFTQSLKLLKRDRFGLFCVFGVGALYILS